MIHIYIFYTHATYLHLHNIPILTYGLAFITYWIIYSKKMIKSKQNSLGKLSCNLGTIRKPFMSGILWRWFRNF
jgi:hypothetical protein